MTEVYIVDDDDDERTGTARLVGNAGMNSRACASSERFLEEVANLPRACILFDVATPRMSGLQVHKMLDQKNIHLPVIAMGALDDDQSLAFAHSLRARLFLRKPVDGRALLDAIEWVTTGQERRRKRT